MLDILNDTTTQGALERDRIEIDGGTQMRAELDADTVAEYAEAMHNAGGWPERMPPVIVFYDGDRYWLGDGFHRVAAHRQALVGKVPAEIRSGTRRDAVLHAAGANADHGLRRTNADKRRAVLALLQDDEWAQWSDREIARRCNVSNRFVSNLRGAVTVNGSQLAERTYTTKHGTTATMDTRQIGQAQRERGERIAQERRERRERTRQAAPAKPAPEPVYVAPEVVETERENADHDAEIARLVEIYQVARDAVGDYEQMTGDYEIHTTLVRMLEHMIAQLRANRWEE